MFQSFLLATLIKIKQQSYKPTSEEWLANQFFHEGRQTNVLSETTHTLPTEVTQIKNDVKEREFCKKYDFTQGSILYVDPLRFVWDNLNLHA